MTRFHKLVGTLLMFVPAFALAEFRRSIPDNFDRTYVEHVVVPFFLTRFYEGERPALPMIDVTLTKQDALPADLWGLIYEDWKLPERFLSVEPQSADNDNPEPAPEPHSRYGTYGG